MVRSLRWRIQVWHAAILLLVVAGFGTTFYLQARRAKLDEIDAELLAGARVLEGVLRTLVPPAMPPPPPGPPRRPRWPGPGGPGDHLALALPQSLVGRYDEEDQSPYFVIWRPDGQVLRAEPSPPEAPPGEVLGSDREWYARRRGMLREVLLRGPGRTTILVGRPIGRELAGLDRLGWRIGLSGLAVLAVGLAGGGWLSSRAVRPIGAISETLAGINARRLSERIDLADLDAELVRLGAMLNEMLGRLESAFEQQVRFTADASHELRTPLSVILAHIELALSRPRPVEEYREALATCGRAAGRMKTMVEDLLTLARADAGQLELKAEPVDLASVAEEAVELLDALARRRGVTLDIEAHPAVVAGDAGRLAQVATNLITNAILYNKPGGSVTVVTRINAEDSVLTVADTGVGISEADLPSLFRRFHRADPARSREHGGSGLGLAICRSIVEAHGGRIAVESRSGIETTVTVRIPIHRTETSHA